MKKRFNNIEKAPGGYYSTGMESYNPETPEKENSNAFILIKKHSELKNQIRDIENKIIEHYKPIILKAVKERDIETLNNIAESLPNIHWKGLIYREIHALLND